MLNAGMDQSSFDLFRDQLERFVKERLVPAENDVIRENRVPDGLLSEMRDMGLFGLTISEEFGGAGMNISQYIETIKVLSWAMPAYRSIISINTGMTCACLSKSGTPEQQAEWLPQLAEGKIASFALTEPDSGSDAAALVTSARRDGDDYILNGTKRYITNAPFADFVIVMARTSKENLPKNAHVSGFIVPTSLPGVTIGSPDEKMGQSGTQIADVILDDVRVPADALLGGEEGKGFLAAMQSLDTGRLSVGAAATGYAARALDTGIRYALERKAFGEPIARFQLIQAMIADSKAEIYAAECMMADAVRRADQGERVSTEASCFKMFATEMCGRVTDRVVQIFGGAGYLREYEAERFFRDARVYRIYEGTTQIQQMIIAKRVLASYGA